MIDKHKIFNRGAIIAPPIIDNPQGFTIHGNAIESQYRFAALYFDRAIYLTNNIIHLRPSATESALQHINFLQQKFLRYSTCVNNKVDDRGPLGATMIADAFSSIPNVQRGRWSLVGVGEIETGECSDFDTIFVNLMGRLPLPTRETTITDILKFNRDHRKSLLRLRRSIGEMANAIYDSKGNNYLRRHVEDKVDSAFDDLDTMMNLSKMDKIRSSISIGFQISPIIIESVAAALGVFPGVATAISNSVSINFSKNPYARKGQAQDWCYVIVAKNTGIL